MKSYLMNRNRVIAILDLTEYDLRLIQPLENIFFLESDARFHRWCGIRQTPFSRHFMGDIYKFAGVRTMQDFILKTHFTSLNDCFWVKTSESQTWESVNLYNNPFNKLIENMSLGDRFTTIYKDNIISPEFTSGGSFPKVWRRLNGNLYLFKGDINIVPNKELINSHNYSEVLTYQLASYLGFDCTEYKLSNYKGIDLCYSKSFTSDDIGFVPAVAFNGEFDNYDAVYSFIKTFNLTNRLDEMFLLDSLTFNKDRHAGNYGFLFNNDSYQIIDFAPIFDNNWALFPDSCLIVKSIKELNKIISTATPKLQNESFTSIGISILKRRTDLVTRLKSLNSFHFNTQGLSINSERLAILEKIVKAQAYRLIKLAESE